MKINITHNSAKPDHKKCVLALTKSMSERIVFSYNALKQLTYYRLTIHSTQPFYIES